MSNNIPRHGSLCSLRTLIALVVVTMAFSTGVTRAQKSWTLEIQDSVVKVNGKKIAKGDLPSSFDVTRNVSVSFSGPDTMVVAMGDVFYVLEEDGLREAEASEIQRHGLPNVMISSSLLKRAYVSEPNSALVRQLEDFEDRLRAAQVQEKYLLEAQNAAATAAVLPHLELQSYWHEMRSKDKALFDRHIQEEQMDMHARQLAQTYRVLPPGEQRDEIENQLREVLNMSFDLKQENRRNEIGRIEAALGDLQQRMEERAKQRDKIIENRLNELVGRSK